MKKLGYRDVEPVRMHFNMLIENGVPQKALERALGFSKEELTNNDLKIPIQNNLKMLKEGFDFMGPGMALKLGTMTSSDITGILGQILKNCMTFAEASHQFIRFQNLCFSISKFEVKVEGDNSIIIHSIEYPTSDEDKQLLNELNLSIFVTNVRELLQAEFVPKEVRFSHEKPKYIELYKQHFHSPLKFNQKENAIIIDRKLGKKTIPGSYPYIKNILVEYAEGLQIKLEAGKQFQDDVKRIIVDLLPKRTLNIERVSEKFFISRWTLNRKLKKEGTTFKELLTALRKEFAINYLDNKKLSITEIAFLLGYSEVSAFQRAFKRWTGKNPNEYRQNCRNTD